MMINIKLVAVSMTIFIMAGCSTWKRALRTDGGINAVVENCIMDYAITSKLCRDYNVFDVAINWDSGMNDTSVINVMIVPCAFKELPAYSDSVGAYSNFFPTEYRIVNGNLYYWNNPATAISEEILKVMLDYDAVDLDWRDREYNIPLGIKDGDPQVAYLLPYGFDDRNIEVIYRIDSKDYLRYSKRNPRRSSIRQALKNDKRK